ncbi:MAG: IPT/TIG domain-containing protein [Nitrososphaerales archaeon]
MVTDNFGRPASGLFTIIRSGVVTLSSNAGIAGSPITIFGSDFNSNSPITIRLGSTTLQTSPASLTTDALGSFETSIRIPNDGAVGSYTITVTDTSGRTGFGLFDVREPAFMTVSPTTGPPGTEVIVTGWNFVNGTRISIKLNSDYVATFPSEILGSELGKFIGKFRIPANHTEGTYTISAEDFTGRVGTTLFTVAKDGLALSLASNNGKGGTVSITGWGLSARSVVKISFDGEILDTIPLKIFTSPTGTFRASINVPGNAPNGNHTISAISNEKMANATLSLDRNYIDDRYGILISAFPQKYNFEVGETVLVSGRVLALANGFPLILKIINPNGAACSFQQLYLDKDMKFEAEPMKLGGKLCSLEGEYKITAYYGKGKALTKFNVAASDVELTGGRVEVMNAQMVLDFIRYDNKYTVDLDWATNAVRIRNNLNETIPFYLMFAEYDADEVTKKLSYTEVTLEPFEKSHIVAPFVPRVIDGKPNGYLHVFAWTTLVDPTPLNPGLYVPY